MRVIHFQRKPGKGAFSIELLFDTIRKNFPKSVQYEVVESTYVNRGLYSKLYNIAEILFKTQGDVNHVTGGTHFLTMLMAKRKTVLTIHDMNLLYTNNKLTKLFHLWFSFKVPMMRSSVVTVISETTKAELLKYTKCKKEKVRVIYNCISDCYQYSPKVFNEAKPVILQIGTKPNKNLERIIQAIENISCQLQIVGVSKPEIVDLLEEKKIDYTWQYNLSNDALYQKYCDCDCLVFASLFEGFGVPIIEANAVGRPVITSKVSATAEVAGDSACLVDPLSVDSIKRGLVKVIKDKEYRESLIQAGLENAKRFTPSMIANQYVELYREIYQR